MDKKEEWIIKNLGEVARLAEVHPTPPYDKWYELSSYQIEIPYRAHGGNKLKGVRRWEYKKMKQEIRALMQDFFDKNPAPPKSKLWHIRFERVGKKLMDYDNLVFSGKPFMDILQEKFLFQEDGWEDSIIARPVIWDDAPNYVEVSYTQRVGERYKVRITLLPLENTNAGH